MSCDTVLGYHIINLIFFLYCKLFKLVSSSAVFKMATLGKLIDNLVNHIYIWIVISTKQSTNAALNVRDNLYLKQCFHTAIKVRC